MEPPEPWFWPPPPKKEEDEVDDEEEKDEAQKLKDLLQKQEDEKKQEEEDLFTRGLYLSRKPNSQLPPFFGPTKFLLPPFWTGSEFSIF